MMNFYKKVIVILLIFGIHGALTGCSSNSLSDDKIYLTENNNRSIKNFPVSSDTPTSSPNITTISTPTFNNGGIISSPASVSTPTSSPNITKIFTPTPNMYKVFNDGKFNDGNITFDYPKEMNFEIYEPSGQMGTVGHNYRGTTMVYD